VTFSLKYKTFLTEKCDLKTRPPAQQKWNILHIEKQEKRLLLAIHFFFEWKWAKGVLTAPPFIAPARFQGAKEPKSEKRFHLVSFFDTPSALFLFMVSLVIISQLRAARYTKIITSEKWFTCFCTSRLFCDGKTPPRPPKSIYHKSSTRCWWRKMILSVQKHKGNNFALERGIQIFVCLYNIYEFLVRDVKEAELFFNLFRVVYFYGKWLTYLF
jgi:hypothetical protein